MNPDRMIEIDTIFEPFNSNDTLTHVDIDATTLTLMLKESISDAFCEYNASDIVGAIVGTLSVFASLFADKIDLGWKVFTIICCIILAILSIVIPHKLREREDNVTSLVDKIKDQISFYQKNKTTKSDAIRNALKKIDNTIKEMDTSVKQMRKKKREFETTIKKKKF